MEINNIMKFQLGVNSCVSSVINKINKQYICMSVTILICMCSDNYTIPAMNQLSMMKCQYFQEIDSHHHPPEC